LTAAGVDVKRWVPSHSQVVVLSALEFLDDLAALSAEMPCFLSARDEERAESELVAQPPRADPIPIPIRPPGGSERKKASAKRRPAAHPMRGL
jgi:hypothetical protein